MVTWQEKLKEALQDEWPLIETRKQLQSDFFRLPEQEKTLERYNKLQRELHRNKTPEMQRKIERLMKYQHNIVRMGIPENYLRAKDVKMREIRRIISQYIPGKEHEELRTFLCIDWSPEFFEAFKYFVPKEAFIQTQLSFLENDIYSQVTFPEKQELISIN